VDVLRVGEANSTEEAVQQLAALGPQAYPALRRALRDPAPFVRTHAQRAVEAIAAEQRRQATQPIPLGGPRAPEAEPQAPLPGGHPPEPEPPPLRRVVAPPGKTRAPIPVPVPERRPDLPPPDDTAVAGADNVVEEGRESAAEAAAEDAVDVAAVLQKARGAVSFGGERDEILAPLAVGERRFTVVVEEVARTTAFDAGPAYRGGSTIRAHLPDTEVAVAVRVPPDHLEAGAPLERGHAIVVAATFRAWDNLYDRGVFEGTIAG
jgi:hypothetical protein